MPGPHAIQINIPAPCRENWDKMTPCGQGRHCEACSKTVTDFTTWSDAALYNLLASRPDICGRFYVSQLQRPIHIPPQPHSRLYRMVVAMGLTLMCAQGEGVYAQSRPQQVQQAASGVVSRADSAGMRLSIVGTVVDEKKQPLIGAIVQLLRGDDIVGGAATDFEGNYKIDIAQAGNYTMVVSYVYYHKVTITNIVVTTGTVQQDVAMTPTGKEPREMKGIMGKPRISSPPGRMIFGGDDIGRMPIR